jgi:hypothetical protein
MVVFYNWTWERVYIYGQGGKGWISKALSPVVQFWTGLSLVIPEIWVWADTRVSIQDPIRQEIAWLNLYNSWSPTEYKAVDTKMNETCFLTNHSLAPVGC